MKEKLLLKLMENSQIYSILRLTKELNETNISNIKNSLEFEITLYKSTPKLINRNYETIDHFLDYMLEVKKYIEELE